MTPHDVLHKYWGYTDFRARQEAIIRHILAGNSALALLPTGGGKSLCYQLPALLLEGITLVISPLLSLMSDQVKQLNERGIKAMFIPGGTSQSELGILLDNCIYGKYKLLYISPERLQQDLVLERLDKMDIALLAVDEAHCISQWGHDFRPAYRNINTFIEKNNDIPCLAVTATATQSVLQDILKQLQLEEAKLFISSFERKNLTYAVKQVDDKLYAVKQLLTHRKKPAIVYVRSRNSAKRYATYLNQNGITAQHYHGGLDSGKRDKRFHSWLDNQTQVMVATTAFGMGIDKADVATIIHVELPESLESYFQEAGRAGRDGKQAVSVIYYNTQDKDRLHNQFIRVLPGVDHVKFIYKKLNNYFQIAYGAGDLETFQFNFSDFCDTYKLNYLLTYNALTTLDRTSVLTLSQEFYRKSSLVFTVSHVQLTYYLIKNPGIEGIVKSILRTYGGIFEEAQKIDLSLIAKKSTKPIDEVHDCLVKLDANNMVTYTHESFDTSITFLTSREDQLVINRVAKDIKAQNKRKIDQVNAVIDYLDTTTICRNIQLLAYFNEEITEPCGTCDVCRTANTKSFKLQDKELVMQQMLEYLKEEPLSSRTWKQNFTAINDETWIHYITLLLEQNKIKITSDNRYKKL